MDEKLKVLIIEAVVAVDRYIQSEERPRSRELWTKMAVANERLAEYAEVYPLKSEVVATG